MVELGSVLFKMIPQTLSYHLFSEKTTKKIKYEYFRYLENSRSLEILAMGLEKSDLI